MKKRKYEITHQKKKVKKKEISKRDQNGKPKTETKSNIKSNRKK